MLFERQALSILSCLVGLARPYIPLNGRQHRKLVQDLTNLDFLLEVIVHYRWLFIVPIALPLSFIYYKVTRLSTALKKVWHRCTAWNHGKRVQYVRDQIIRKVAQKRKDGSAEGLVMGRPDYMKVCTRDSTVYKTASNRIDVPLYEILSLDESRRSVWVEPYVTVKELNDYLIPRGWTLPIVADLDELTCGGLFIGYGTESSALKHGLFQDIVKSTDVVIGDGTLVHCSDSEHVELFRALPWSHGSLGICVCIELPIIPAKRYVRLVYQPCHTQESFHSLFTSLAKRPIAQRPSFLEGLMFTKEFGVVMTGEMTDTKAADGKVNSLLRWWKPWFYKHVEAIGRESPDTSYVEYIPLQDYYHRHNRSLFWEAELIIPFGNHPLFRYLLGWLMPIRINLLKRTQTPAIKHYYQTRHAVQDLLLPLDHQQSFFELAHRVYEVYPVWFCPHICKRVIPQGMLRNPVELKGNQAVELQEEFGVDVGLWGVPGKVLRDEEWDAVKTTRTIEAWLRKHRGYQALYAVTEMTREEFWTMFDRTLYDRCRRIYHAEGVFMDVYDKLKKR